MGSNWKVEEIQVLLKTYTNIHGKIQFEIVDQHLKVNFIIQQLLMTCNILEVLNTVNDGGKPNRQFSKIKFPGMKNPTTRQYVNKWTKLLMVIHSVMDQVVIDYNNPNTGGQNPSLNNTGTDIEGSNRSSVNVNNSDNPSSINKTTGGADSLR